MDAITRFVLRRRGLILISVGIVTVVLICFASQVQINQEPEELIFKDDPQYPVLKAFFEEFGYDEIVVVAYSAENVLEKQEVETLGRIGDQLLEVPGVDRVLSFTHAQDVVVRDGGLQVVPLVESLPENPAQERALWERIQENPVYRDLLVSRDAGTALFDITLESGLDSREREAALEHVWGIFSQHTDRFYLSGSPVARAEIYKFIKRDFSTLLPLGVLLLVVSMYLVFRNFLCILLPMLAIGLSTLWTIGFIYLVGSELNLFSVIIPTIIFIIGTSDCIHILSQYQDCRHSCATKGQALRETLSLMVQPCLLTSITTMACLASLHFGNLQPIRHFGVFAAVGIGFAFMLSITLLPIGLSLADTRALTRDRPRTDFLIGFLARLERMDRRRRGTVLVASLLVFALGIWGATLLHVETDAIKFGSKNVKTVSDTLFIEEELGGVIPLYVVVDAGREDGLKDPELLNKIENLAGFLRSLDGVDKVVALSDVVQYINYRVNGNEQAFYTVPPEAGQVSELFLMASLSGDEDLLSRFVDHGYQKTSLGVRFRYHDFYRIEAWNQAVRAYLAEAFPHDGPVQAYTTGTALLCANIMTPILTGLEQSLFVAGAVLFVIMTLLFRSAKIALLSMVPNFIPLVMTLGTMGLLGISLNLGTAPLAAIALGVGIDDTIHFLARFRKEVRMDGDHEAAVWRTMRSVGKPILITSLVLSAGFVIFLFSNFQYTRSMGMLISFTVVSAVFADLVLLPALLLVFKPLKKAAVPREVQPG